MPINPSIITSGNQMAPVQLPDVNTMMQTRTAGMENMYKLERQREADVAAAQKQEAANLARALAPAIGSVFADPSDEGLNVALGMVPEQYRGAMQAQIDQLRAIPDLNRRKDVVRAALVQDEVGQALLAQLEPTANMRLQADTAAQRAALDQRRMALEEQKLAAETAAGGQVSPDKAAELAFRREELAVRKAEQEAKAAAEGKGKVDPVAATKADDTLSKIMAAYQKLKELKAITSTKQTTGQNIAATISAKTGSTVGAAVGSEAQTQRQIIKNLRQALLNDIKAATGMSSKAIDSNVELQSFLNSLGDPENQSYEAAIATIGELSAKYAGGALSGAAQNILKDKTNVQITAPPPSAVEFLRQNPQFSDQFDAKYGAGAAAKILGE